MNIQEFNHIERLVKKLNVPQGQESHITIQIIKQCKSHKTNPLDAYLDDDGVLVLAD
jgi:transcription initiation factor TFIIIB Brf1 subunit/transcription initiation factor TFIIB